MSCKKKKCKCNKCKQMGEKIRKIQSYSAIILMVASFSLITMVLKIGPVITFALAATIVSFDIFLTNNVLKMRNSPVETELNPIARQFMKLSKDQWWVFSGILALGVYGIYIHYYYGEGSMFLAIMLTLHMFVVRDNYCIAYTEELELNDKKIKVIK